MTRSTHEQQAREDFLKRAPEYQMTVELDQGIHRHLRFRIGDSMCYGFDIVTWPGYLSISGDMGCFVFCRLRDMFEFFRGGECGRINPGYWSEKLQACDGQGGYDEFSADLFEANIREELAEIEASDELIDAVEDDVLRYSHDGEAAAIHAAMSFEHDGRAIFPDFWETSNREYTFRFLWCCHAIVWAIRQYDEYAQKAAA